MSLIPLAPERTLNTSSLFYDKEDCKIRLWQQVVKGPKSLNVCLVKER
jgi:hypothetical protein